MNLQRLVNPVLLNTVVPLEASHVEALVTTLSGALHDEPNFLYMVPDERTRRIVLPSFFRSAIRAGERYGEIHMTENADAVAIWIRPEHNRPFRRLMQTAFMPLPFNQRWEFTTRYMNVYVSVEEARKRVAPVPHWYLMFLGVEASQPENVIREVLIEPMLCRADSRGMSCYLETHSENRLAFYEECGFRIGAAGRTSEGGPDFWAMTRAAVQSAIATASSYDDRSTPR